MGAGWGKVNKLGHPCPTQHCVILSSMSQTVQARCDSLGLPHAPEFWNKMNRTWMAVPARCGLIMALACWGSQQEVASHFILLFYRRTLNSQLLLPLLCTTAARSTLSSLSIDSCPQLVSLTSRAFTIAAYCPMASTPFK